jgi:hypothetical protein
MGALRWQQCHDVSSPATPAQPIRDHFGGTPRISGANLAHHDCTCAVLGLPRTICRADVQRFRARASDRPALKSQHRLSDPSALLYCRGNRSTCKNSDSARMWMLVGKMSNKRLTYRRTVV